MNNKIDAMNRFHLRPAMILANKDNVQTGLGKCIFYDTVIQHGNGDDLDSISAIIRRTEQIEGGIVDANEAQWVQVFLKTRRHVLIHPRNKENRNQIKWKESVERVDILLELAEMANWDLNGPIHIDTPYHKATIL
jgi:chitosanase